MKNEEVKTIIFLVSFLIALVVTAFIMPWVIKFFSDYYDYVLNSPQIFK